MISSDVDDAEYELKRGRLHAGTAGDAVLNAGDLETRCSLPRKVTVKTTGSGVQANNIDVTAKLGWSANALALDSYQFISVAAPITVKGRSGLSILTNDGGSDGTLSFGPKGNVTFQNLSSMLTINGTEYTLENSVASLASAVMANRNGAFALAASYDATSEGIYTDAAVSTPLRGKVEGLGNRISGVSISVRGNDSIAGFFERFL